MHKRWWGRRRLRVMIATTLLMMAVVPVAGCTPGGSNATEAVRIYLDRVANGGASDLEALWKSTATEDPAGMRAAGEFLTEATERITVVEIGEAQPADVSLPWMFDTTKTRAVMVPVRYRLAGREHSDQVVLALADDVSARDPDSWRIVDPLTGSIAFTDVPASEFQLDAYVSGKRVSARAEQPLYPATYTVDERAEPYLATEPTQLTVPSGQPTNPPVREVLGTEATVTRLEAGLKAQFDTCRTHELGCPLKDALEAEGVDFYSDWWLGLRGDPTITLAGRNLTAEGTYRYRNAGGTKTDVQFTATGLWAMDVLKHVPAIVEKVTVTSR